MKKPEVRSHKPEVKNEKAQAPAPIVPAKEEAHAFGRYLKISPTKVRDLARLIRGKNVSEAETILKFSGTRGGGEILAVLHSASANAGAAFNKEKWFVAEARANQGPIFRRRVDPKARGSRGIILTRSTHLSIVVRNRANESSKGGKNGA